jgi:hypothetical protein
MTWDSPEWWDDLVYDWDCKQLTENVIAIKRARAEQPLLTPECCDYVILLSSQ